MLVDELKIHAKAGNGGDGVVRWRREKFEPNGGPAGGNGGKGGDVYVRAVRNLNLLAKYTGAKKFTAESGVAGSTNSQYGKGGGNLIIDIPVGSRITDMTRERVYELNEEGQEEKILKGGEGGLGNKYFKSSTNTTPRQSTNGKEGEEGEFLIELILVADVGLVGQPNAGKSTLLNMLTKAHSDIGAYPFTTLEPHLGDLFGYVIADIPGLIEGAAEGKGLGHKFLRHVTRTKMLLHIVSLEEEDPISTYYTILNELSNYDPVLLEKESWIILTKKDLVNSDKMKAVLGDIDKNEKRVFVIAENDEKSIKNLSDALVSHLEGR
ncbi:MAG: GTPase ObgE [Candidatus Paceibacterota bacterium]